MGRAKKFDIAFVMDGKDRIQAEIPRRFKAGKLRRDHPRAGCLFGIGRPPAIVQFLARLMGKLAIVEATFSAGAFWVGGLVLAVGLLTLMSMARTWADSFWRPAASGAHDLAAAGTPLLGAIAALSLLTVGMAIGAEPLFELTSRGAQQSLLRDEYLRAVLGGTP